MRIVDANVLLYAVNEDARHHEASRSWLDRALGGEDTVGLTWIAMLAFARISTRPEIFAAPLTARDALAQLDDWTAAPGALVVHPGARHLGILSGMVDALGTGGNIVNDAHLAALAIEHRAEIVSYDNDFGRFEGVRWTTPDALVR